MWKAHREEVYLFKTEQGRDASLERKGVGILLNGRSAVKKLLTHVYIDSCVCRLSCMLTHVYVDSHVC